MTDFQKKAFAVCIGFFFAVIVLTASVLAAKIGQRRGYSAGYRDALASVVPDTEYVDKPIYIDKPVPVEVKPAGVEMHPVGTVAELKRIIDSLATARPDTAFVEVPIPIETKLYRDSTYEAQVSGWHPSLDWIKVNQRTVYIHTELAQPARKARVGFGFAAGPAVIWTPDGVKTGAGFAGGISVTF